MEASLAHDRSTTHDVVTAPRRKFAVQVRFPRSEWVTVTRLGDHRDAIRAAARAYREGIAGDGRIPCQVRLVEA